MTELPLNTTDARMSLDEAMKARVEGIAEMTFPFLRPELNLQSLLTPGQFARFRELTGQLIAVARGRTADNPEIRATILECLDTLTKEQCQNTEIEKFVKMMSEVLYESASAGISSRAPSSGQSHEANWSKRI